MLGKLLKLFMSFHISLMRLSRGRVGSRFARQTFLILHTTGHRTGRSRVIPISYFSCDGYYFLVGSNWARNFNASWYYNLIAHPQAAVEINGKKMPVIASEVSPSDYDRLWKMALVRYPAYKRYQEKTTRHIPIVILKPLV
jgi:F420H(2)-dependent quinone reductase